MKKSTCTWTVTWEKGQRGGSRCAKTEAGAIRLAHALVGKAHRANSVSVWYKTGSWTARRGLECEKVPYRAQYRCRVRKRWRTFDV